MNPSENKAAGEPGAPTPKNRIGPLTDLSQGHDWVTLISCANILEADIVRSQLDAAGIAVFIPDEHLMTAAAWALNAYGYVRL